MLLRKRGARGKASWEGLHVTRHRTAQKSPGPIQGLQINLSVQVNLQMWTPWIMGINGRGLMRLKTTFIVTTVKFSAGVARDGGPGEPPKAGMGDATCSGQLSPQAPDLHHGLVTKPVGLTELRGAAGVLTGSHSTCG